MIPFDFFNKYLAAAKATQAASNVPAAFTLAQAAVESAWAQSGLSLVHHNFFGIKAQDGDGWTGDTVTMPTREIINGQSVIINAAFRAYPDDTTGFEDHAKFLTENERYADAFNHTDDPCAFAMAIAAAGYATAENYGQTICGIIKFHNLADFCV